MQGYTFEEGYTAANLNMMDFPALRRNPFIKSASQSTQKNLKLSSMMEAVTTTNLCSKKLSTTQKLPQKYRSMNLSPAMKYSEATLNVKSQGMTSHFTADSVERYIEENPSFALSDANSHSRRSGIEVCQPLDTNKDPAKARQQIHNRGSRQSSISKVSKNPRNRSPDKENIFRMSGGRSQVGSAMRCFKSNISSSKSPIKVFQEFMKDV